MKKIILSAISVLSTMTSIAQSQLERDKILIDNNSEKCIFAFPYRLYPT